MMLRPAAKCAGLTAPGTGGIHGVSCAQMSPQQKLSHPGGCVGPSAAVLHRVLPEPGASEN